MSFPHFTDGVGEWLGSSQPAVSQALELAPSLFPVRKATKSEAVSDLLGPCRELWCPSHVGEEAHGCWGWRGDEPRFWLSPSQPSTALWLTEQALAAPEAQRTWVDELLAEVSHQKHISHFKWLCSHFLSTFIICFFIWFWSLWVNTTKVIVSFPHPPPKLVF